MYKAMIAIIELVSQLGIEYRIHGGNRFSRGYEEHQMTVYLRDWKEEEVQKELEELLWNEGVYLLKGFEDGSKLYAKDELYVTVRY